MSRLFSFADVIARAKECFGCNKDSELAGLLGISPQTLNNRKKTESIPYEELLALAIAQGKDIQYILTGIHAVGIREESSDYTAAPEDPLARRKSQIKAMIDQADSGKVLDAVQEDLEKNERIRELERKVAELEKKAG